MGSSVIKIDHLRFLSHSCLIVVGDQAYHRCVVCKLNDDVGFVLQRIQHWHQSPCIAEEQSARLRLTDMNETLPRAGGDHRQVQTTGGATGQRVHFHSSRKQHTTINPKVALRHIERSYARSVRELCSWPYFYYSILGD
ncbi:CXXC-type zinc finger protein 1a [Oncorhynchus mykiss]|uniref:CXXC-type zinc finger protein 1a n=1 Tax=Oncorhynchus mykiss TaxID=8022 RepID=UPI001877B4C3|nr:CXXC-type zinc finger protein 1a [Oncorhynchus mykiss]